MKQDHSRTAVFTIIANNYGAHARVLLRSLAEHQPDWERFVLIADVRMSEGPVPAGLARVVYPAQLSLPNPAWFSLRYNILEASTAVKPWMIEYLFDLGFDRIVYLDPDIKVFSPFQEVVEILDSEDLILTPHSTRPYPDSASPSDLDIRRAGIYNLGFVSMKSTSPVRKLLAWWQDCCRDNCRQAFDEHIFVDQSWMDFAPSFVPRTRILHHTGYNVAYWNLHYRSVDCSGYPASTPRMHDGSFLRFFHFSGTDPAFPRRLSKHQTRIADGTWPSWLATLIKGYFSDLEKEGYAAYAQIPWRLNPLADFPLPEPLRQVLLQSADVKGVCMRPVSARRAHSVARRVLTQPDRTYRNLPVYLAELYRARADLKSALSERDPQFASKLSSWFKQSGCREFRLDHQLPADGWWNKGLGVRPAGRPAGNSRRPKVNFYGCFAEESNAAGVAQGCIDALGGSGLALRPVNSSDASPGSALRGRLAPDLSFPDPMVEIVQVTGPLREFFMKNPDVLERASYKIACWEWDYSAAPADLQEAASIFDEIWCLSRSSRTVFKKAFSGPVRVVTPNPAAMRVRASQRRPLPVHDSIAGKCVFLTLCDCATSAERQNPAGALASYLTAFPEISPDCLLVVGLTNSALRLDYRERLERMCAGRSDVRILAEDISPDQALALTKASTALISLHASGGPLLEIARALGMGKHVVVTDFGGAAELCSSRRGHKVACRVHETSPDATHFPPGARWVEADVKAAGKAIRRVADDWDKGRAAPDRGTAQEIRQRSMRMHRSAMTAAIVRAKTDRYRQARLNRRLTAVIFGAGSAGERLARNLGPLYRILGIADNDRGKKGQKIAGYPVVGADDIAGLAPDRILIASMYWQEIHAQLLQLGFQPEILRIASI